MKFAIIIPAHNEEDYLAKTLNSLVNQDLTPLQIIVVNDNSTDSTQKIISDFATQYTFIEGVNLISSHDHQPGSKVVSAFKEGLKSLNHQADIICKFDADLIFPNSYLSSLKEQFEKNIRCGIAGGYCTIKKKNLWVVENLTGKDHIRGALKAYRKACFDQIGGLKSSIGWDTVDELLARYHGWEVCTIESLHVKHLKPTGHSYNKAARYKQGEAFKKLRYGFSLSAIAALKLAINKRSIRFFFNSMVGYLLYRGDYLVSAQEGKFIRKYRWKNISKKLLFKN